MIESVLQLNLLLKLIAFFAVLMIGAVITRTFLMTLVARTVRRKGGDEKAVGSAENIAVLVGMLFTFVAALQAGGFGNLVTLLGTVAAAATVAIGFGMRDQIANLMAGIFLHIDTPFVKGDYIESGEVMGTVKQIGLRATSIEEGREKKLVPNAQLTTQVTVNHSKARKTYMTLKDKFSPEVAEKASENIEKGLETIEGLKDVRVRFNDVDEGKIVLKTAFSVKRENPNEVRDVAIRKYADIVREYVGEEESVPE